jgi:hypothetical protein
VGGVEFFFKKEIWKRGYAGVCFFLSLVPFVIGYRESVLYLFNAVEML